MTQRFLVIWAVANSDTFLCFPRRDLQDRPDLQEQEGNQGTPETPASP